MRPVANQQSALALPDDVRGTEPRSTKKRVATSLRRAKARLKPADRRLFHALQDTSNVLFLDIETTGLSRYYDEITIVGWLHDGRYEPLVAGDDPGTLMPTYAFWGSAPISPVARRLSSGSSSLISGTASRTWMGPRPFFCGTGICVGTLPL